MRRLEGLLSQAEPAKPERIQLSPKAVEKPAQSGQSRIVQMREWWNHLDYDWKNVFKKAINICKISWWNMRKFKKAVPNCQVDF